MTDWSREWFPFDDATYLNSAAEGPMPRTAIKAVERALEAKAFPHRVAITAQSYAEIAQRLRASLARLVGGHSDEIALTTGASAGPAALALGLPWERGDEVLTGVSEFPLQFTTWRPLAARDGVALRVVKPKGRFLTAEDFVTALSPRTRLVSASLVRFSDGAMLEARVVADACHAQGARLCLDVSQCCGAVPLDAAQLGADFMTCAGYKWLLSPYGTGFFWASREQIGQMRPAPFYWMAIDGADDFSALPMDDPRPSSTARRWDAPEWSGPFNPNLAGMAAAVEFVEQLGPATVREHTVRLVDRLLARLPASVEAASPHESSARGPFGCFRASTLEGTQAIYRALGDARIAVSLRESNIRVAPHVFNTEQDIDRLVDVIARV
jgi:selenocysteine lyase/cysteine desulfurase